MNDVLRIGTFNVRWANPNDGEHQWQHRRARLFALLHGWQPDVLGLQEPRASQLDDLREALPEYDSIAVGRDDGKREGEFCPLFYRRERLERIADGKASGFIKFEQSEHTSARFEHALPTAPRTPPT